MDQAPGPGQHRSAVDQQGWVFVQGRGTHAMHNTEPGKNASTCGTHETESEQAAKSILVATDFSAASSKAIEQAVAIARQEGSFVTILHVIDVNARRTVGTAADLMKSLWERGEAQMSEISRSLPRGVRADTVLEEGLPWE